MKKQRAVLLLMLMSAFLLFLFGCSKSEKAASAVPTKQVTPSASAAPAKSVSIAGTWYINSTDATIWFNDGVADGQNPSSDFTVKNFDLQTLKYGPNTLNATYSLKDNVFSYEAFSGDIVSFNYQLQNDGSLIFTGVNNGQKLTLTRRASSGTVKNESGQTSKAEFVPDYRPGHENTYGQPDRNLASVNHGQVGIQDQWIYYFSGAALYKMNYKEGLTSVKKIGNYRAWQINVVGDWIYFNDLNAKAISKVRTDGSMYQKVVTGNVDDYYLYVSGNYLFYKEIVKTSASERTCYLIRMDLNTGEKVRLIDNVWIFWGKQNSICYLLKDDNKTTCYMDYNGKSIGRYQKQEQNFQYLGDRKFMNVVEFFKDGSNKILVNNAKHVDTFYVIDHYLYFSMEKQTNLLSSSDPYGFYGYDLNTGKLWKINGDTPEFIWCIGDGYIYYTLSDATYVYPSYRCKPDGSGWEELKNSMYPGN